MSRAETRHFTARHGLIVPVVSPPAGKPGLVGPCLDAWARIYQPTDHRRDRRKEAHKQRPAQVSSRPTAVGAQATVRSPTRPRKLHTACLRHAGGTNTSRHERTPHHRSRSDLHTTPKNGKRNLFICCVHRPPAKQAGSEVDGNTAFKTLWNMLHTTVLDMVPDVPLRG